MVGRDGGEPVEGFLGSGVARLPELGESHMDAFGL